MTQVLEKKRNVDSFASQNAFEGLFQKENPQQSIPFVKHDNVIAPIFFKTHPMPRPGGGVEKTQMPPLRPSFTPQAPTPYFYTDRPVQHALYTRRQRKIRKKPKTLYSWLNEEVSFSMNKLSLAGMIACLMAFGVLFFCAGFIVAVSTTKSSMEYAAYAQGEHKSSSPATKWVTKVAGRAVSQEIGTYQAQLMNKATNPLVNRVPAPLQPFAARAQIKAQGQAHKQVQHELHQTQRQITYGPSQQGTVTYYAPQTAQQGAQPQPNYTVTQPSTYSKTPY